MDLEQIRAEVAKDMVFDDATLDREALRIPQLHGKYLNFLTDTKLTVVRCQQKYDSLYRLKWEYYTGKMDQSQLEALKWEPFQFKLLRTDVDMYLNTDPDLQNLQAKLEYEKAKFAFLESTLKDIMNRQWMIRCAIDFRKFITGVS